MTSQRPGHHPWVGPVVASPNCSVTRWPTVSVPGGPRQGGARQQRHTAPRPRWGLLGRPVRSGLDV